MGNQPSEADTGECIGELLDQAMDLSARFLSDRADLSASAAFVLNRVCREGAMRLTTLATKEGISQPSMTQLVQRLERQELVTRLPDPDDGRVSLIGITARGRMLIDERKRIRRDRLRQLLATLTPDERCTLWLSARTGLPVLRELAANANCPLEGVPAHPDPTGDVERKVLE